MLHRVEKIGMNGYFSRPLALHSGFLPDKVLIKRFQAITTPASSFLCLMTNQPVMMMESMK